ncbi:DnaJ-domain-containing protein [Obba rivulosa]|uniref:DnaJ-domain-containing protein n=1 Tax=Obba rivulosa TaxID=1052685 RepID=A0A8E2DJ92_9APHY|nr:DnaJ-domain-containing protein [Obba rivulosa]
MANYNYDEAGNMAAYFLLTFLSIVLIPLSISSFPSRKPHTKPGCECQQCREHCEQIRKRERGSILHPKFRRKTIVLLVGWVLFALTIYKVSTTDIENKVYDPFEILGLRSSSSLKEIKSHYKKLSRLYHPDKVKLGINETMEAVEAKFVSITKAYKSLTDETIRKNLELYGHPDGRQEVSMGIALPKWIVESGNNIWVLGVYGLIFGGALPALVGRWWFGNRRKTKDGVDARSAATFFKALAEESGIDEVVASLGKALEWEHTLPKAAQLDAELGTLENKIKYLLDNKWDDVKKLADIMPGEHENRRRAFVLLYAHVLRLPVENKTLREEQAELLLQTPTLLNSMLNISLARSWLLPTLAIMRLHAYLIQALPPGQEQMKFAQLPGIAPDEATRLAQVDGVEDVVAALEAKSDSRAQEVKKTAQKWGRAEIVNASFRVIGEKFVVPSSIVFLLVKLRLTPPFAQAQQEVQVDEDRDNEFLLSRKDAEDLPTGDLGTGWAHAPFWPANRKPSWWIVLADVKTQRVVVPPMKVSDVPTADRGYRSFKIQFQAPPTPGVFTWKLYLISETFIGEEVSRDIILKIDDASVLNNEDQREDEISDPEEDSLAGQVAMMRGGSVKKKSDESDDESSTDDDEERKSDAGSSSDSD